MAKVLVKATLYRPTPPGDIPANGYIEARPSLRRDIDDSELDAVVLPARSKAKLGAALTYTDDADVEHTTAATPGVAWFWIDATDAGADANLWFWTFTERTDGGTRRYCTVPTSAVTVDYADLPDIDPDDYSVTPPAGTPAFAVADTALHATISAEVTAEIGTAIDGLLSGAPGALDTLNELAAALGDDANFATTVTNAIAAKADAARTVNGHPLTDDVTVSKSDVGLGSVDNTADVDKPISTAAAAALTGKQPLATMLTKIAALSSTLTEGQLIRWDATLGEPVAVNPVGNSRLAAGINVTGTGTAISAAAGTGTPVAIPGTQISVGNSGGRSVSLHFGGAFSQTVAAANGTVYLSVYETTGGSNTFRATFAQQCLNSSLQVNLGTQEWELGTVTTTRTFELRGVLTTTAASIAGNIVNSTTYPTFLKAIAE